MVPDLEERKSEKKKNEENKNGEIIWEMSICLIF